MTARSTLRSVPYSIPFGPHEQRVISQDFSARLKEGESVTGVYSVTLVNKRTNVAAPAEAMASSPYPNVSMGKLYVKLIREHLEAGYHYILTGTVYFNGSDTESCETEISVE